MPVEIRPSEFSMVFFDAGEIQGIVEKLVAEMAMQLEAKKVRITLAKEAREWLAEKGFDPLFGARRADGLTPCRLTFRPSAIRPMIRDTPASRPAP